jgi:hypothetical protein
MLAFNAPETGIRQLNEVLILRTDLAASTAASSNTRESRLTPRDTSLKPFALGIPKTPRSQRHDADTPRWRILPGASIALVLQEHRYYADTHGLRSWCDLYGDFTNEVKDQLHSYFTDGDGSSVRSFISLPLFDPDGDPGDEQAPFGILNIHANEPDMLHHGDAAKMFAGATDPLSILLCRLLIRLRIFETDGGTWWSIQAPEAVG